MSSSDLNPAAAAASANGLPSAFDPTNVTCSAMILTADRLMPSGELSSLLKCSLFLGFTAPHLPQVFSPKMMVSVKTMKSCADLCRSHIVPPLYRLRTVSYTH